MLNQYYVNHNSQLTGEHEVHKSNCSFLPNENNRVYLGFFDNCNDALKEAKAKGYNNVDGCAYCNSACHTR